MKWIVLFAAMLFGLCLSAQNHGYRWAAKISSSGHDKVQGVGHDGSGNCYVAGKVQGPVATIGTVTFSVPQYHVKYFFAKYDSSGNVGWVSTFSGPAQGEGLAVKTDSAGNSLVLGSITNGATTSSINSVAIPFAGNNSKCIFVCKYNNAGTAAWCSTVATFGSAGPADGFALSADNGGNSYICGNFGFSSSSPDDSLLLVRLDHNGQESWRKYMSRRMPGSSWSCRGVSSDNAGNSVLTGVFTGTVQVGNAVLTNTTSGSQIFTMRFDSSGYLQWARIDGKYPSFYYAPYVSCDASGNSYVTGIFLNKYAEFGGTTLVNVGGDDIFIVKYDPHGNVKWAKQAGGLGPDWPFGICCDNSGNIYLTGFFGNSCLFDKVGVYSNGINDAFIVKYDSLGNAVWAANAGGTLGDYGRAISADNSGNVYAVGYFDSSYPVFGSDSLVNCDTISNPSEGFVSRIRNTSVFVAAGMSNPGNATARIFPNPFSSFAYITTGFVLSDATLYIYDQAGRLVDQKVRLHGDHILVEKADLSPGFYYYTLLLGDASLKGKMVISSE